MKLKIVKPHAPAASLASIAASLERIAAAIENVPIGPAFDADTLRGVIISALREARK